MYYYVDLQISQNRTHHPSWATTVLPKMHILEEHTVPLLRRWHAAVQLNGERGAESEDQGEELGEQGAKLIHAYLNKQVNKQATTY